MTPGEYIKQCRESAGLDHDTLMAKWGYPEGTQRRGELREWLKKVERSEVTLQPLQTRAWFTSYMDLDWDRYAELSGWKGYPSD